MNKPTRGPVQAGENQWVDEGEDRTPEDKTIKYRKTQRTRPKAEMVKITCGGCNKDVEVPASLPRSKYYRCERCSGN